MEATNSWLTPIPNKRMSKIVTDKITEALATGEIKPGDYLPSEGQLAKSLNVGKSSVREAIKMLEAIGVVEIIRGNGSRVKSQIDAEALSPLTYQLLLQSHTSHSNLVQFRQTIEMAVNCLAIDTITDEEIDSLRKIQEQMLENNQKGIDNLELDIRFHEVIYSSTHNPFFACIGTSIMQLFKPSMAVSNKQYSHIVLGNHAQILHAFECKNKNMMEQATLIAIEQWNALTLNSPE